MTFTRTDDTTVRQVLTALRDVRFSWRPEDVGVLADRLGWELTPRPGGGVRAVVPWALASRDTLVSTWPGGMSQVDLLLSDSAERTPEVQAAAADAFAGYAEIATGLFGPPFETDPGPIPSISWRTAESAFELGRFLGQVTLNWSSAAYQQYMADTDLPDLDDDE